RNDRQLDDSASEDEYNPFADVRRHPRRDQQDSDSDDEEADLRWESSFKLEIPEFRGSTVAEELLDWFVTVEELLEFKRIPLNRCVPLIAIRFRDTAAAWWSQRKSSRA
ncbi:hypothetical protein EUTSA_v10012218mg, partial [Eutrema salsugineum]